MKTSNKVLLIGAAVLLFTLLVFTIALKNFLQG